MKKMLHKQPSYMIRVKCKTNFASCLVEMAFPVYDFDGVPKMMVSLEKMSQHWRWIQHGTLWCLLLRILKVYRSSSRKSGYTLYTSKRHHISTSTYQIRLWIERLFFKIVILWMCFYVCWVSKSLGKSKSIFEITLAFSTQIQLSR